MEPSAVLVDTKNKIITITETMSSRDLYSKLKEMWTDRSDLICHPFPMNFIGLYGGMIHIEMLDGWNVATESVGNLIDDFCWCCNQKVDPGSLRIVWTSNTSPVLVIELPSSEAKG